MDIPFGSHDLDIGFLLYKHRERAQSEVIGVVLLTGVIVLLATLVGVTVLGTINTSEEPVTNLDADVEANDLTLSHTGGSSLSTADVTVVLDNGTAQRHSLETFDGDDGDDQFSPGERLTHSHNATATLRIVVVHEPSNTVLYDRTFDVPKASPTQSW